jgi:nucleoside-diphosphate-sugar epimerase
MGTVAVTGSSGYLGRKVLERLAADTGTSRVVGIDVVEPEFSTPHNLEFYRTDIRSPDLGDLITGCDALVHLATNDSNDPEETFDVNVGGTRAVTDAASRSGIRKLIFASSVAVYGAHPDNDYPLTERSAVRPAADNAYARAKAEAEELVDYFARAHPDVVVTTLRFSWVVGPSIPTARAALIDAPVRLAIAGYDVPVQAVHEDDMAGAVMFALTNDLPGVYNVAADDSVEAPADLLGQRKLTLSLDRARMLVARASKVGLSPWDGPGIASLLYPQVMSNAKLVEAGFRFERSAADALREGAEARRGWTGMGRLRFRPRRVALVAGSFGAVLLGSAARSAFGKARREKA